MNLTNTANEIREHHAHARRAFAETMEHALEAGRLLALAKAGMAHGTFGAWVEQHCGFSDRTARRYMQLHAHREALPEGAGVRGALEHLREPRIHAVTVSMKTDTVSDLEVRDQFAGPLGQRPAYMAALGKASFTGDLAKRFWLVWEVAGNFAHALHMPVDERNERDCIATFTKSPIRYDFLGEQLEALGLPAADRREWLPIALNTALQIRAIAAGYSQ